MKIICFEGSSGAWSWMLKDDGGHVIARSERSYKTRAGVEKGVEGLSKALGKNLEDTVFEPLLPPEEPAAGG